MAGNQFTVETELQAAFDTPRCLTEAAQHAMSYLDSVPTRPVGAEVGTSAMYERINDGGLPEASVDPEKVITDLVEKASPGLTAMNSPRFFGLVVGGTLPVALAADWLVSTWDQNAILARPTPAIAAIEQVTGEWLLDLFGLPSDASFAFVTGCQMAHVTALAAARHRVLAQAGWDVERDGLLNAPQVTVIVGGERHVSIDKALRLLGLGSASIRPVGVDSSGAMLVADLEAELRQATGPTIVCAQVGNVNTGAIDDPIGQICELSHAAGAWVHVDGAFGLWASASPRQREQLRGYERADSWATDAHMWLNVPYDCGLAFVRDADAHRAAIAVTAAFFEQGETVREPLDWNPESSRRARSLPVYAALRSLGREGVAELVDRLCSCADRFAERLASADGFQVLTHGLNQVLVRVRDDDDLTQRLVSAIQQDGTCWMSASTWHGMRCIRISVCSWRTTLADVDMSVEAMQRLLATIEPLSNEP